MWTRNWRKWEGKENWEVIKTQVLKHLPRAGKGKRGGSHGDAGREVTALETIKKSRGFRIIEEKEIRRDSLIETFSHVGQNTF